ncbi:putative FAD-linked oxidoreductase [invertebrate metagenome]|uniref:Putative FAD-linked oxidoreductase n=1 Tax=invertebrate metagenome TaxID=1711999 RepID=A0A2H9T9U0_9ZZZZ
MIKKLPLENNNNRYHRFLAGLISSGFKGDTEHRYGERTILATDNSIYQVLPQAVIYPSSVQDIAVVLKRMALPEYHSIVLSARGGGTGTNGQSLTDGIMLDTSRYMNKVLEINPLERWARVEAGVVKDVLNDQAAQHGLFFAPELSTSNRATIGGMVNTDASGQGSVTYGKTRHHVLELTSVFSDGTVFNSQPVDRKTLEQLCQRQDTVGKIHRMVQDVEQQCGDQVARIFPPLNRNLTGYDLAHITNDQGQFNLNAVLCGSEGTLAVVTEIKVNLLPIPEQSVLVLVFYSGFLASLLDARHLMSAEPTSIETIDSKVLALARKNEGIWNAVSPFFPEDAGIPEGINFVEFCGNDPASLKQSVAALTGLLKRHDTGCLGYKVVTGQEDIQALWTMRKQSVGLLGNMEGDARPIPFVEDVAVPPENLAPFIEQFRALLDQHQLHYGMFGHVDAGVLHVRPAIDMKDERQAALVRTISDQVNTLAREHGGVLWGEHGKGFRSEYAPAVFQELYPVLQQIKQTFDPRNQLNPGKIAAPEESTLLKIDEVPTRGEHDRSIHTDAYQLFTKGMYCNGNGACFNYDQNSAMCPTFKATADRIQSPKGRAGLVREWLRLQSLAGADISASFEATRYSSVLKTIGKLKYCWGKKTRQGDFSHEVYQALDSCMSCKSCAGQCPVKVSIPDLRSRYFSLYHDKYPRPVKHSLASSLESFLPWMARTRRLYNWGSQSAGMNRLLSVLTGLTDLPAITHHNPLQSACSAGAVMATPEILSALSPTQKEKSLIIVQDAFTSYFETPLLDALIQLLIRLGYQPLIAPFLPNGKVLHVYGYQRRFEKVAEKNGRFLSSLAASEVPLVGIDAAVTLTYRDEYHDVLGKSAPQVRLLSEWFYQESDRIAGQGYQFKGDYILLGHCTESTNVPAVVKQWQQLFAAFGLTLTYQPTGCCGMSGIYGHETRNQKVSRKLYDMSWQPVVDNPDNRGRLVATGYSCRSQVKRFSGNIPHPVQVLLRHIKMS